MTGGSEWVETPGQTVGPFFAFGLEYDGGPAMVAEDHPGAVRLRGRVTDGEGAPVPDALVEIWQADAEGRVPQTAGSLRRDAATFTGWGGCGTRQDGTFAFTTVEPGPAGPGAARFFAVTLFARGLLHRLHTRAYLPDEDGAVPTDSLLDRLDPARRDTLVVRREDADLVFDICVQGPGETVFLSHDGRAD
jgi:protocatechuate 3,4-dioxygenase alpha subunit